MERGSTVNEVILADFVAVLDGSPHKSYSRDGNTIYLDKNTYNALIQTEEGIQLLNLLVNPVNTRYASASFVSGYIEAKTWY